jgi:hypothetical protein
MSYERITIDPGYLLFAFSEEERAKIDRLVTFYNNLLTDKKENKKLLQDLKWLLREAQIITKDNLSPVGDLEAKEKI